MANRFRSSKKSEKAKRKGKRKTTRRRQRQRRSKKYKGGMPPIKLDLETIQQPDYDPDATLHAQSVVDAVKELIKTSNEIYTDVLASSAGGRPRTIICGGQSPAYFCLAMMNFKKYDPASANILVLPFSKESDRSSSGSGAGAGSASSGGDYAAMYCERLEEKGIRPNQDIVIIDYIESGEAVARLINVLQSCYTKDYFKTIKIIALNETDKLDSPPLSKYEKAIYPSDSVMQFSERFKRLVPHYPPSKFGDSASFTTDFNTADNPLAEMIIDLASEHEGSDGWYAMNEGVY